MKSQWLFYCSVVQVLRKCRVKFPLKENAAPQRHLCSLFTGVCRHLCRLNKDSEAKLLPQLQLIILTELLILEFLNWHKINITICIIIHVLILNLKPNAIKSLQYLAKEHKLTVSERDEISTDSIDIQPRTEIESNILLLKP